jgi:DnaJ like chaperone protein
VSIGEIVVMVVGLAAGYWMVANFIDGKREQRARTQPGQQFSAASKEPAWYQVLEVAPTATPEEIRHAYQRLMSLYHPDKVASLGEEIRAVAERKAKEISVAYAEGLRQNA